MAQTRKALGLTQNQVAEQLGISQQTLAHYEVGRLRIAVLRWFRWQRSYLAQSKSYCTVRKRLREVINAGPASKLQQ
ncbi:helix-turn-helix transcriptional regulator [Photobacterium sp. 1_MG-2023]|uniref:helix-turn-helix transcriptional regulator n=1 Tax=Photobacterium sp. 1_MG-2023 TaxID=3062646 RepID=UPI0034C66C9B